MKKTTRRTIAFCVGLLLAATAAQAQNQRRNVLLIIIDDLNDYITLLQNYPGVKTPNFDRFAKTALTFSRAYCAAPVCNPSRAAVLSGVAPYHTGVYDNDNPVMASQTILNTTFLPEHFKANGYTTITRGKIFHTMPGKVRFRAMWDDDGGQGDYGPYPTERNVPDTIRAPKNFNYQPWTGAEEDHPDNVTAAYITRALQKNYEAPFLMTCGLYKPHNPWTAPKRFFDMFPLKDIVMPKVFDKDWDDLPPVARQWADNPVDFEALKKSGKWKEVVRSYLACIAFMDYNLGRVLDALDSSRYQNNTLVCLFADNGFHMGEKHHFAKYALWEQTTHIIHMWRVPGITPAGEVCTRTVNLLDVYPTLDELCGLPSPKQKLDGRSMVTLLKNPTAEWNYPAVTTYKEGNQAVRTEHYRYIRYSDGGEEFYDEDADPLEWHNLAGKASAGSTILSLQKYLQNGFAPAAVNKGKKEDE